MTVIHNQPAGPQFCKSSHFTEQDKIINLNDLPKAQQQQIWRGIKQTEPALAEVMQFDETLKELKTIFDASIVLERADAARFYRAGKN